MIRKHVHDPEVEAALDEIETKIEVELHRAWDELAWLRRYLQVTGQLQMYRDWQAFERHRLEQEQRDRACAEGHEQRAGSTATAARLRNVATRIRASLRDLGTPT